MLPHLTATQRRAVQGLREQLAAELSSLGLIAPIGGGGLLKAPEGGGGGGGRVSKRRQAQIEALQAEIDGYLAAECPLCGDVIIRTVGDPLVDDDEEEGGEALAWDVN